MNKTSRIYLTGFMTSGKSTIGPILANVLGWEFCDLDKEIETAHNKTVVQIFEHFGEDYFRKTEAEYLTAYSLKNNIIISLGGGTIVNDKNLEVIKNTGLLVYLKVSRETLQRRLKNKTDRPLFRDLVLAERPDEEFANRIDNLLNSRAAYYEQADITIESDKNRIGVTIDILANKIMEILENEKLG